MIVLQLQDFCDISINFQLWHLLPALINSHWINSWEELWRLRIDTGLLVLVLVSVFPSLVRILEVFESRILSSFSPKFPIQFTTSEDWVLYLGSTFSMVEWTARPSNSYHTFQSWVCEVSIHLVESIDLSSCRNERSSILGVDPNSEYQRQGSSSLFDVQWTVLYTHFRRYEIIDFWPYRNLRFR